MPQRRNAVEQPAGDFFRPWSPPIETEDVFRELILAEVRSGRMTPARRARIIRYAAQLGLSPVLAGKLISQCHAEAGATTSEPCIRLVPPAAERPCQTALSPRAAIITGLILLAIGILRALT